jgi:uncharacterized protein (DUF362 family)
LKAPALYILSRGCDVVQIARLDASRVFSLYGSIILDPEFAAFADAGCRALVASVRGKFISKMTVYLSRGRLQLDFIEIKCGDHVVIKPNLVKETNLAHFGEWESVITSGWLIETVCEYVAGKLSSLGRLTICDAPQTDSSFTKIDQLLGLSEIAARVAKKSGVRVDVLDLRNEEWLSVEEVIVQRTGLAGDPAGAVAFDLADHSLFYQHSGEGRYYGADYDAGVVNDHHRGKKQEYLVCGTPIKADVFINMPKLKTHKKTGVTLNLKNLVGINADKNWLPHHTDGSPADGGDQFPDLTLKRRWEQRAVGFARSVALSCPGVGGFAARKLRKAGKGVFGDTGVIRSGNWHGNDTTWRMVLDLNRCLLYGNPDGSLRQDSPKRYYSVVDGLVGMEGNGPMHGTPIESGVVIGGTDPVAVDMVAARVMGFDWRKIPVIREAFAPRRLPITAVRPEDVEIVSDEPLWQGRFLDVEKARFLQFKPHFGWKGHIEYEPAV